jgi:hypothetical protein
MMHTQRQDIVSQYSNLTQSTIPSFCFIRHHHVDSVIVNSSAAFECDLLRTQLIRIKLAHKTFQLILRSGHIIMRSAMQAIVHLQILSMDYDATQSTCLIQCRHMRTNAAPEPKLQRSFFFLVLHCTALFCHDNGQHDDVRLVLHGRRRHLGVALNYRRSKSMTNATSKSRQFAAELLAGSAIQEEINRMIGVHQQLRYSSGQNQSGRIATHVGRRHRQRR